MLDSPIVVRFTMKLLYQNQEFEMNQSFQVSGMTCGHCEMAVKRAVKQLDPAADIQIDRSTGKVDVTSEQPREQLVKAIADEGYAVAA